MSRVGPLESASGWVHRAKTLKTTPRRIEFRKPAAFLFYQIIFSAACALRCRKNVFPIAGSFSEENLIAFRRIR